MSEKTQSVFSLLQIGQLYGLEEVISGCFSLQITALLITIYFCNACANLKCSKFIISGIFFTFLNLYTKKGCRGTSGSVYVRVNNWKIHQNVCLCKTCWKAGVNSLRFWGSTYTHSKNKLAGRSFFQNLGSQGPGHVSPGGSSRAAPSTFFAACSEA